MPSYIPQAGYLKAAKLTVTGNGTNNISGSTSLPGTGDYIVPVHLTGSQAASVYNSLTDTTNFTDFSCWWWDGSIWNQIDVDVDTDTYGAWSASNVAFRFKLFANLAAAGTDSNYMICWNKDTNFATVATTMQSWANMYIISDGFDGVQGNMGTTSTVLGSSWTKTTSANGTITVASGVLTMAQATNASSLTSSIQSPSVAPYLFGVNYICESRFKFNANTGNTYVMILVTGTILAYTGLVNAISTLAYTKNNTFSTASYGTYGSLALNAYHVFGVSRTSTGLPNYFLDGVSQGTQATATNSSNAITYIGCTNKAASALTTTVDWIKVRPWVTPEPAVTMGGIGTGQTIPVSQTTTTAFINGIGKLLSVSQGSTASVVAALIISVTIAVSQASLVSLSKDIIHNIAVVGTSAVGVKKGITKSLPVAQTTTTKLTKDISHTIGTASGSTLSLIKGVSKKIAVSQPSLPLITKAVTKIVSVVQTHTPTISAIKTRIVTIAVATTSAVGLSKGVAKTLSIVQGGTAKISRSITHTIAVSQTTTSTIAALKTKIVSIAVASTSAMGLTKAINHTIAVIQPHIPIMSKGVSKLLSVVTSTNLGMAVAKTKIVTIAVAQASSASILRGITKTIGVAQGSTARITKSISKTIAVIQGSTVALIANKTRIVTIAVAQTTLATISKGVAKRISVAQGSTVASTRSIGKQVAVVQSSATSLYKGISKLVAVHQANTAVVAANKVIHAVVNIVVGSNSTVMIYKGISKTIAVFTSPIATLWTVAQRLLVSTEIRASYQSLTRQLSYVSRIRQYSHASQARALSYASAARALSYTSKARALSWISLGPNMAAIPEDPNAVPPYIGTKERNISYQMNFTKQLVGSETLTNPTAQVYMQVEGAQDQDVTATMLQSTAINGNYEIATIGNKNAIKNAVYKIMFYCDTSGNRSIQDEIGNIAVPF